MRRLVSEIRESENSQLESSGNQRLKLLHVTDHGRTAFSPHLRWRRGRRYFPFAYSKLQLSYAYLEAQNPEPVDTDSPKRILLMRSNTKRVPSLKSLMLSSHYGQTVQQLSSKQYFKASREKRRFRKADLYACGLFASCAYSTWT